MKKIYHTAQKWHDLRRAVTHQKLFPHALDRFYLGKRVCEPTPTYNKTLREYFLLSEPLQDVRLTRREVQVMYFICQGCTNKEVGVLMGLSPRTTEYYIKNVRKKTTAHSKSHLVQLITRTDFLQRVLSLKLIETI